MVWYPLRVPNSKQGENLSAPVSPLNSSNIHSLNLSLEERNRITYIWLLVHLPLILFSSKLLAQKGHPSYYPFCPELLLSFFPLTYASKSQGLAPPGKGSVEGVMCWALLVLINMKTAGQLRVKDYRKGKYIGFTAPQYCTYSTYSECLVLYVFYN